MGGGGEGLGEGTKGKDGKGVRGSNSSPLEFEQIRILLGMECSAGRGQVSKYATQAR